MKKKEINYQLLIRRICLIVLDIICIIAASILALLTRFEFDFSQIPKEFLKVIYKYGPFTIVITLIIFSLFRIYSSLWEYAGIEEVFSLIAACLAAAVAKIVIILFTWSVMPRSWYVLDTIYLMILIGATRVSYRLIRLRRQNRTFPWSKRKKVMIIGGGEAGRSLITEIQNSKYLDQKVVCIIDDDPYKIGRYIKGVKVVGNRNSIKKSVKKYNVQQIILTIPSANAAKIRPIVEICQDTNCELMILPGVYQLVNGEVKASKLRPVNIDDLLGRDEVHVNLNEVMDNYSSVSLYTVGSAVMDVLEEPKVPYTPDNPLDAGGQAKKGGLVAGALVLILLGLFSYMKNTIKQENEIEKKLDARSLGAISYEWKYKTIRDIFRHKKKAILVDDPVASFRFVESYKKLAAKVEYRMAKNEQKVLVVTSVSENEGKSTVAANLAITLAEQSKRVLLVDGDIRRPSQFLIFGMEPKEENELGEYLRGNGSLADVMVPCTRKHMLFMGGKNCYSSSTEMLNSDSFYKLMTACRKFVDYVIIDTPPAGIIGDAQIFAHCADAVMIVAKQNYMLAEDINEVMDAFRDKEGKVLGVVLNGVRSFSGLVDSPVGHYYGKYSKYGRYGNYGRSKGM